ncbi:GNAT family N-acetyltransferase [Arundinibacter roseus]|uniref:GNAT family N-acetyltransferase n=2 Tax=Arundinibacter roseus TaxID=2070510 RepID=A0A4R4K8T3_9BACT|nr:GNAT family N-acetyltransferase [Arundinibacter roseus]
MLAQHSTLTKFGMTHPLTRSPQQAGLELLEVDYPEKIKEIGRFRIKGWKMEKGVDPAFFSKDTWIDSLDQRANHWVITKNQQIVAASRLSFHDSLHDVPYADFMKDEHKRLVENRRIASINRLVVAPDYRGIGLSGLLDQVRIDRAVAQKAEVIIAFPQLVRLEPLKKKGFILIDQLENIPEMPERPFFLMIKNL